MTASRSLTGRGKERQIYCGAKKRQSEGTCTRPAGWGTDHVGSGPCKLHGGNTKNHRAAGLKARAEAVLYQYDAGPVANPLEALQSLAGRALALEQAIGGIVNDLTSIRYGSDTGGEQLRSEVAVLERAMDRAGRLLVDIAKLNIDERLARVTERQTEIVAGALAAALGEMGLSAEQQRDARSRVARHLRSVA